jgi:hypothetical protein
MLRVGSALHDPYRPAVSGPNRARFFSNLLEPTGHRGFDPRTVFGPTKYQRLLEVKRRYDPDNVFHVNNNIPPR